MNRQGIVITARSNFAGIYAELNTTATTINMVEAYEQVAIFTGNMPEFISNGLYATNRIIVRETGIYEIMMHFFVSSSGVNKEYEFNAFEIAATGKPITAASQADPCVITSSAHGFDDGEMVKIVGVKGMVELNDRIFTVANKTDDNFQLHNDNGANIDSSGFTEYTSRGEAKLATRFDQVHIHRLLAVVGDIGSMSGSGYASLVEDNAVEAWVKCATDSSDLTIESCQMTVKQM